MSDVKYVCEFCAQPALYVGTVRDEATGTDVEVCVCGADKWQVHTGTATPILNTGLTDPDYDGPWDPRLA